jgi:RNA polymerase sigma-70 factor (ECF subfamily)
MDKLEKAMCKLQDGDGNALGEIYDLTSRGVFSFVLPIIKDYQLAEDIMQQTYIRLYKSIQTYQKNTNPTNWILTIAKNVAYSEIKKRKQEYSCDFSLESFQPDGIVTLDPDIDAPTIALANKILFEEEFRIVLLYVVGEYKHREIAKMLNLPIGTVTWKYNEAIKKIRIAYEKRQAKYEAREKAVL